MFLNKYTNEINCALPYLAINFSTRWSSGSKVEGSDEIWPKYNQLWHITV